jgi:hypothetical protein
MALATGSDESSIGTMNLIEGEDENEEEDDGS